MVDDPPCDSGSRCRVWQHSYFWMCRGSRAVCVRDVHSKEASVCYPPRWLAGPSYRKPTRRPRCPSARDHVMCRTWRQRSPVWKRTRWSRGCGSCAPCALPRSLLWQSAGGHRRVVRVALSPERLLAVVPCWEQYPRASNLRPRHGPRAHHLRGVHDGFVYDLCWRAFERSGAHPLVISCGGGVVKILELPEEAACVRNPGVASRAHPPAQRRLLGKAMEGEVRCQRERLMKHRVRGTRSLCRFLPLVHGVA